MSFPGVIELSISPRLTLPRRPVRLLSHTRPVLHACPTRVRPHAAPRLRLRPVTGSLGAADVLDYLRAVGLIGACVSHVDRAAGRHRSYVVSRPDGSAVWYLKQFRSTYAELDLFEREKFAGSSGVRPALAPAFVDDTAQVVVYRAAGASLWRILYDAEPLSEIVVTRIREAIGRVPDVPSKPSSSLPVVLSRLAHRVPMGRASLAERRVLTALLESDTATRIAATCAGNWDPQVTVHGDLKLEHVLVSDADQVVIVDWELSGPGPPGWDRASILQSLLVQPLLDLAPWSRGHQLVMQALADDSEVSLADLAPMVALRLWQSAVEWASTYTTLPQKIVDMTQLGLNVAENPRSLSTVIARLVAA